MNPELRRNLWLELTGVRLVVMPAVLAVVFLLAWLGDGRHLGKATGATAMALFVLLTWVWAAHLAAESVLSELRGRTWDWQRMSGVAPWSLAWGKLAGATAYPWYGALPCLAVLLVAETEDRPAKGTLVATLLLGALLAQAVALLFALQVARRDRTFTRAQSSAWFVLGALFLYPFFIAAFSVDHVDWYGLRLAPSTFALRSLVAFDLFALLGLWVTVRRELRVRTLPWGWVAFVLFLCGWTAGFAVDRAGAPPGQMVAVALAVAVLLTWVTAFGERKDPVALARLVASFRADRWRHAAEEAPAWLLTLPIVLALAGLLVAAPFLLGELDTWRVRWTVVAAVAFLLRDLALLLRLNLGARPRRADLFAAVLLVVGYVLLPLLCEGLKWNAGTALFLPNPDHAPLAAASSIAQAGVMIGLVVRQWRLRSRLFAVELAAAEGR